MNLNPLIDLLLRRYVGGIPFFNKLDNMIRKNKAYLAYMINEVTAKESFDYIIVSGNFGKEFRKYCKKNSLLKDKVICVNGSLRENENIIPFWKDYDINNKKIIFIDDSFYSGRTRNKVKEAIINNKGIYLRTYVYYDGSKTKEDDVISFYRYYDYH